MGLRAGVLGLIVIGTAALPLTPAVGEVCTTQSQMKDADRDALAAAARDIATKIQSNDAPGLRSQTVAEFAANFAPLQSLVAETAPRLAGGAVTVDQVYLLDATEIKAGPGATEAQFFCTLNKSSHDVEFFIPGLTPGIYGFAVVPVNAAPTPWVVSMLLRREGSRWLLAGIYPRTTEAGGHDGLWYWREARRLTAGKQLLSAWVYFGQAEVLLRPADFVGSSHLEKLHDEQRAATPPAISGGIGPDIPLVIKGADGKEFQIIGLGTDDSLARDKLDISAHLRVTPAADAAAARKRNEDAMHALLHAYPELRDTFHGIWIVAEPASGSNQAPFATEEAMTNLQ